MPHETVDSASTAAPKSRPSKWRTALLATIIAVIGAEFAARLVVADWAILDTLVIDSQAQPPCFRLRPNSEAVYEGWGRPVPATTLRVNAETLRGPRQAVARDKRPRVALVGDSHVFGLGVRWADTLGVSLVDPIGVVAGATARAEVINFGVPGYDFTAMVARVEEDVRRFCPDTVVVLVCANDLDNPRCGRFARPAKSSLRRFALGRLWMESQREKESANGLRAPLSKAAINALIDRIRAAVGVTTTVVLVTICRPVRPEHVAALSESASRVNAVMVDVSEAFGDLSRAFDSTAIRYDEHLNGAGNRALARHLAKPIRAALTQARRAQSTRPQPCVPNPLTPTRQGASPQ